MSDTHDEVTTYTIPPNFVEGGTFLGGLLKVRNTIEALALSLMVILPVLQLSLSLTAKIIILCLTALPLALLALVGISGESLCSFIANFFIFLAHRRILDSESKPKARKHGKRKQRAGAVEPLAPASAIIPVKKVENGIIYTKDHRYIKFVEVNPINFLLRSAREQRNIIYSYMSFLKIAPVKMQIKVLTKRADISRYLNIVDQEIAREKNEQCRILQMDYKKLIQRLGHREAVTRRFFLAFEYELEPGNRRANEEDSAISALQTAARSAATYLRQCGNTVVENENEDEFQIQTLYEILNRKPELPLEKRVQEVIAQYLSKGHGIDNIPVTEFIAPKYADLTHGRYLVIDGTYYSYWFVPSAGYKPLVAAGWMSLIVNAGDGIDMDLFMYRQPKERIIQKVGQQIRINRSKIKGASDTNTDFDDLDGAIRSGYYLKDGLANNEDFYYVSTLITITADSLEELEWREREMRKLLISRDLDFKPCLFRQEQALVSSLPVIALDKSLFIRSRRNTLTSGVASCYPYTSYEICDENGILLGVNKHNNSLVMTDNFNSHIYKSANIFVMGCTGAGKTFLIQLMALRHRRKGRQVFIIAPIKGHEFRRACNNVGGAFISISPASQNCINIMEIRLVDHSVNDMLDGPGAERSELAAKIQQLHIFFSLLVPDMTYEERQLLDEAMIRTYQKKGITHDNSSLWDPGSPGEYRRMPILGDLYDILLDSPATTRLANILNRLVNGSASSFNQQTNVDLSNKYVVLDISELTGDLLTPGMFLALDYVWDKVKEDRTKEKIIIIDELWELIGATSNPLAAGFALEVAKVNRAFGGGAVFATQDSNDCFALEDGKYGRGIINACPTKIVLNMEDEEAQRVKQILHLSESELMEITHFERGSGLLSTNNNNVTIDFKASELEKELITTDRSELVELLRKKQESANTSTMRPLDAQGEKEGI